jgi:hypothetical protein
MNEFIFSHWTIRPLWQLHLIWAISIGVIYLIFYYLVIVPIDQQWAKTQQMGLLQQQTLIQLTQTLDDLPLQTELTQQLQQLMSLPHYYQPNNLQSQIATCINKTGMKLLSLIPLNDNRANQWQLVLQGNYAQFIDWLKVSYQYLSNWYMDNIDIHVEQETTQFSFVMYWIK